MATKAKATNTSADKVVIVNETDIWNGQFPKRGEGYTRDKAALTAIAAPLTNMAVIDVENGHVIVSFPKSIILPKTFTRDEVLAAVAHLMAF